MWGKHVTGIPNIISKVRNKSISIAKQTFVTFNVHYEVRL